MNTNDYEAL